MQGFHTPQIRAKWAVTAPLVIINTKRNFPYLSFLRALFLAGGRNCKRRRRHLDSPYLATVQTVLPGDVCSTERVAVHREVLVAVLCEQLSFSVR